MSPDGDCLGSALGLAWALRQLGKQVACVLARDEEPPSDLMFLPGADGLVPAAGFEGPCECFIAVDVPTPERLGDGARLHEAAPFTVTVDHHAVPRAMSDLSYTIRTPPPRRCSSGVGGAFGLPTASASSPPAATPAS